MATNRVSPARAALVLGARRTWPACRPLNAIRRDAAGDRKPAAGGRVEHEDIATRRYTDDPRSRCLVLPIFLSPPRPVAADRRTRRHPRGRRPVESTGRRPVRPDRRGQRAERGSTAPCVGAGRPADARGTAGGVMSFDLHVLPDLWTQPPADDSEAVEAFRPALCRSRPGQRDGAERGGPGRACTEPATSPRPRPSGGARGL